MIILLFLQDISDMEYMKRFIRILLFVVVLLLVYMCVVSVRQGMKSDEVKQEMLDNLQENGDSIPRNY